MPMTHPLDGSHQAQPERWLAEIVVFALVATFALIVLSIALVGVVTGS
jgi:nitrate reductase NapE component